MRGESVPQSCLAGVREVAWGAAVYEQAALPPSGGWIKHCGMLYRVEEG